jgi:hypothetical protein
MTTQRLSQIRILLTTLIALTTWSLLVWQYLNEGVPSHYLLHRSDMPSISNWWGGLLLPTLFWFLLGRIHNRECIQGIDNEHIYPNHIIISFACSFFYGVILSLSFAQGIPAISSVMFPGILFFALFFRVYREEYLLGFIFSMSFIFGAVLSTIFGTLIAIGSAIVYSVVQFIFARFKQYYLHWKKIN